ncbi:uncharacterized protein PRCAT00000385001 [Priceomyces carsonii]|uniref:uncharacterized protein n=1 Tax=Priceomyces carsonii TaxID=28549 RepID=UPI002ED85D49|nr:unnamed protein product [Priceomyces carsonii]
MKEKGIEIENFNTLLPLDQLKAQIKLRQEELLQQQRELAIQDPLSNSLIGNSTTAWSFTQGLVIGQLSVILVVIIFIKFFVFAESSATTSVKDASGVVVRRDKKSSDDDNYNDSDSDDAVKIRNSKLNTILEKTYYDVNNHASESLDWFNVLIAQTISQVRNEALLSDNIYYSLNQFLAKLDLPEYLDRIQLTEIDIGDDFPIFSNCRIKHSADGSGRLEAQIDVDLSDSLTLGIETRLLLNHPRPLTAVLPVELSVTIVRISGCITVSLVNTNDHEFIDNNSLSENGSSSSSNEFDQTSSSRCTEPGNLNAQEQTSTALMFSFAPDFRLEFTVKSLIGSRAKLQNVPKISSLVESKLRAWFTERCVEPRFQMIKLPSLWPRSRNTRESTASHKGNHNNLSDLI